MILKKIFLSVCASSLLSCCQKSIDRGAWVIPAKPEVNETGLTDFASGKFYLFDQETVNAYPDESPLAPWSSGTKLTDGKIDTKKGGRAVGWNSPVVSVTLDLGSVRPIEMIRVHAFCEQAASVLYPSTIDVFFTKDKGQTWGDTGASIIFTQKGDGQEWGMLAVSSISCRYVKLVLRAQKANSILLIDEIQALGPYKTDPKYVPKQGAYHGAFNNSTSFQDNTDPSIVVTHPKCPVDTYEALVGKQLSMMLWYQNMTDGRSFSEIKDVRDSYWGINYNGKHRFMIYGWLPVISSAQQAKGELDDYHKAYFAEVAMQDVREKGPVWFRPANEMNGGWVPYYNDPENYVKAWRRMYNIAEQYGVTAYNVFVWSPNSYDSPSSSTNRMALYYPGDIYVDWLGISCYPPSKKGIYLDENLRYPYTLVEAVKAISSEKPIMISEGGYSSNYGQSESFKDEAPFHDCDHLRWIREWFGLKDKEPRIKAVIWENHVNSVSGDRRIHRDADALSLYKKLVDDDYWLDQIPEEVHAEMENRKKIK